ncbi:MAG: O-antigen ligase family protein [bacterium]
MLSRQERVQKIITNWALPIFFFLLPWQTRWIFGTELISGEVFEFGVLSLYATEVFLLLIAIARLARLAPLAPLHKSTIFRRTILILFIAALSILHATNQPVALVQLMHLGFAMLLFLLLLDPEVKLKRVMIGFTAGLILPVALGVYQIVAGGSGESTLLGLAVRDAQLLGEAVVDLEGVRIMRAYGSFSHPNVFGGYLAVGLAGIVGLWHHTKSTSQKWLLGIASVLSTIGLVITFSRSAWLGIMFGLALGALVLINKSAAQARRLVVPISIIFIGLALAFSITAPLVASRLHVSSILEQRSVSERIVQYREFPSVIGSSWLFGRGLGNYPLIIAEVYPDREWWEYQPVHNVVLLIIGEIGVVGLIMILWWAGTIDKINYARFPNPDAVTAFMMGSAVLVILFFDHYIWSSWAGLALIAYVMAMTVRLGEES